MFWFDFNWQLANTLNQFYWPIQFILLAVWVSLGYLAYKKPALAVGGVLVLLPTYLFRSEIWFLPITFLEACIWVVFLGWLARAVRHNTTIRGYRYPFRNSILLVLLAATIALFFSPNLQSASGLWKAYFIEPILFFLVVINVLREERNRSTILVALGLSSLSVALYAIFQKFSGFGIPEGAWLAPETRRVTAMFTSPNAVGLYLAPIIALYAGWLWQKPEAFSTFGRVTQIAWKLFVIGLGLTAVMFTVSQGAWLGLGAAFVFLLFFGWSKLWTGIGAAISVFMLALIPVTRHKLIELLTLSDPSGQNRLTLWQGALEHLVSGVKPFLFGAGILGFAEIQNAFRDPLVLEPLLYPHNLLLNIWTELGLLGVVSFGLLIIQFFVRNSRAVVARPGVKWLQLGVMAAMITVLTHGLIDVPYFKNDLAVLFWTILALTL